MTTEETKAAIDILKANFAGIEVEEKISAFGPPTYGAVAWRHDEETAKRDAAAVPVLLDIAAKTIAAAEAMKHLGDPWGQVILYFVAEALGDVP
jgi:hypothetical protein